MRVRVATTGIILFALLGHLPAIVVADHGNANVVFETTWQRTDLPVLSALATRTWIWGPGPNTEILHEPYVDSETGERSVRYYDKSRMEVTYANGDQTSIWYVTNGLLVIELMTGRLQLGDNSFEQRTAAEVNVAGDASDPFGPTYRTIAEVRDEPPAGVGEVLTQRLARSGSISVDAALANEGIEVATIASETGHAIAQPFWDFMNSSGTVSVDGEFTTDLLFQSPYFATGFPVSEPYWADVNVGGEPKLVLLQCFERRCLTYTPDNAPEWQVEAGNVGLHYYDWRYTSDTPLPEPPTGDCDPGSGQSFAGQVLLQPSFISQELICANFSGSSVAQGNFSEANAFRADFTSAELLQPIFRNTNLNSSVFTNAMLDQPIFEGASAAGAQFDATQLFQPTFNGANLLGADMESTQFVMPSFTNTICPNGDNSDSVGGTCLGSLSDDPDTTNPAGCSPGDGPDFSGQELTQTIFTGQGLVCASFVGASVSQGDFTDVDAHSADFSSADLGQPMFTRTILDSALFVNSDVAQPIFDGASVVGANFSGATLGQPIFQGSNLLDADLRTATMTMPIFVNTTCPDSTNSDDNGGTCIGHLDPVPPPTP